MSTGKAVHRRAKADPQTQFRYQQVLIWEAGPHVRSTRHLRREIKSCRLSRVITTKTEDWECDLIHFRRIRQEEADPQTTPFLRMKFP